MYYYVTCWFTTPCNANIVRYCNSDIYAILLFSPVMIINDDDDDNDDDNNFSPAEPSLQKSANYLSCRKSAELRPDSKQLSG